MSLTNATPSKRRITPQEDEVSNKRLKEVVQDESLTCGCREHSEDDKEAMSDVDLYDPDASLAKTIQLEDDVKVCDGQASFSKPGDEMEIPSYANNLQQMIFDRLPLSQSNRKEFYIWLLEQHQIESEG